MGDLIFFYYVFAGEGEESAQGDSRCAPANMEKRPSLHLARCHLPSIICLPRYLRAMKSRRGAGASS